jgi:lysyl-tRNA synthetase, class II
MSTGSAPVLRLAPTVRGGWLSAAGARRAIGVSALAFAVAHAAVVETGGVGTWAEVCLACLAPSLCRGARRSRLLAIGLAVLLTVQAATPAGHAGLVLAGIGLVTVLAATRRAFPAAGDPATRRAMLAAAVAGTIALGVDVLHARGLLAHPVVWSLLIAAPLLACSSLRPWSSEGPADASDRRRARAIVERHGADTLAPFALRRDKRYFFSRDGSSLIAYRVVAGVALVSGHPIGPVGLADELLDDFTAFAHVRGWRVAALGVGAGELDGWLARGFRAHYTGEEAIVRVGDFSLEGRAIRKVRQSVARLERAGYRCAILRTSEIGAGLAADLGAIADGWRGAAGETGYSMAFDGATVDRGRDDVYAIGFDGEGRPRGFLHLGRAAGALSLSSMRRDRTTPNGLNEFLIVRVIEWAQANGIARVSLTFAAFAAVLGAGDRADGITSIERLAIRSVSGRFQLERLRAFADKFGPDWHPRYAVYRDPLALPRITLAAMTAEGYLALPRARRR